MSPDGITLFLITGELKSQVLQGRVDRVYQPEQLEIVLIVRKPGQNLRLLLSAHAENARLHLTSRELEEPGLPAHLLLCPEEVPGGKPSGQHSAGGPGPGRLFYLFPS